MVLTDWRPEEGTGGDSLTSGHSQTPFFIAASSSSGSPSGLSTNRNGWVATDFGVMGTDATVVGPPLPAMDVDWTVADADFPVTISGFRIRAARTGAVASGLWLNFAVYVFPIPHSSIANLPIWIPAGVVSFALSDLPLVDPANNYSANAAPIVPQLEGTFQYPIQIASRNSVIWRALFISATHADFADFQTAVLAPTANVVIGTTLGGPGAYSEVANSLNMEASPPQIWGDTVGGAVSVRSLSFFLGFGVPSKGRSYAQIVGG